MVRFSVIAPNLNEMPHFDTHFLRSLAAQTHKDLEIIVVDGGSTDGCSEAVAKYLDLLDVRFIYDARRNIGYLRNVGAELATGDIIFETSSDVCFEPDFFEGVAQFFEQHPEMVALGGRIFAFGHVPLIAHLGHGAFDLIRFAMTCRFMPVKKIRPSGNFLAIRREVFKEVGGYPEVKINEDGLFGYKLDEYLVKHRDKSCRFSLKHRVHHRVKRFEARGGLSGILFYIYIFRIIFPILTPLLLPLEKKSGEIFANR